MVSNLPFPLPQRFSAPVALSEAAVTMPLPPSANAPGASAVPLPARASQEVGADTVRLLPLRAGLVVELPAAQAPHQHRVSDPVVPTGAEFEAAAAPRRAPTPVTTLESLLSVEWPELPEDVLQTTARGGSVLSSRDVAPLALFSSNGPVAEAVDWQLPSSWPWVAAAQGPWAGLSVGASRAHLLHQRPRSSSADTPRSLLLELAAMPLESTLPQDLHGLVLSSAPPSCALVPPLSPRGLAAVVPPGTSRRRWVHTGGGASAGAVGGGHRTGPRTVAGVKAGPSAVGARRRRSSSVPSSLDGDFAVASLPPVPAPFPAKPVTVEGASGGAGGGSAGAVGCSTLCVGSGPLPFEPPVSGLASDLLEYQRLQEEQRAVVSVLGATKSQQRVSC
jgi:hypothetical protein